MIDRELKRSLGQMIHGVQVVGAAHDGIERCYTSHWVSQVAFGEPIVLASVSPRHDTHPLIVADGRFSVSLLAADQVEQGQYFSYPGRRFGHVAGEYIDHIEGLPVVRDAVAWLVCTVEERLERYDHDLFLARVVATAPGRIGEPPLLYSSRLGWRMTGEPARERGTSIRDRLLARIDEPASGNRGGAGD
jgi:flavin reductase (DIM6/NTAB) family NADH-FMN oxidoreductase RutF